MPHQSHETGGPVPDQSLPRPLPKREPMFNLPRIVVGLLAVLFLIHAVRIYLLTDAQDYAVILRGAFIPIRYSGGYPFDLYAVTSTVTYALLHGSWVHLIANSAWLLVFGSPLAVRLGASRFLIFWVVTAWAAVLLHFLIYPDSNVPLIGASGAISGMMGAAARFGFAADRRPGGGGFIGQPMSIMAALTSRTVLSFLAIWFVINLVTAIDFTGPTEGASIAWEAHIGGFLVGFLAIGLFVREHDAKV